MVKLIQPGIYFGLPEADYHADPALSQSGIREIHISPLDFWCRFLDPQREDEDTVARIAGKAFHTRLLEPERFDGQFAVKPDKAEYPDALDGAPALKARCKELGQKRSGTIAEMCERILDEDPEAELWPVIMEDFNEAVAGRYVIPPKTFREISATAEIVMMHPDASRALRGGYAEVSVFWVEDGIRMKSRFDYLKPRAVVDVKSFENFMRKPIDRLIGEIIARERYDIQAYTYLRAVAAAKQMLIQDKSAAVHLIGDHPKEDDEQFIDWLVRFANCPEHAFFFVFIGKKVPNVKVREFVRQEAGGGAAGGTENSYWAHTEWLYQDGQRIYADHMRRFGSDKPWIDNEPAKQILDIDLPAWAYG